MPPGGCDVSQLLRVAVLALLCMVGGAIEAWAQRAVFLVRHAEKTDQSEDPMLSAEGLSRARLLADMLRAAGVTHVITTEYERTKSTARPLAKQLSIVAEEVPARDIPALVRKLRALPADAVVLVVGHSNTVPPILAGLGWANTIDLKDRDYDDLFLLVRHGSDEGPTVVRMKYGRRTSQ